MKVGDFAEFVLYNRDSWQCVNIHRATDNNDPVEANNLVLTNLDMKCLQPQTNRIEDIMQSVIDISCLNNSELFYGFNAISRVVRTNDDFIGQEPFPNRAKIVMFEDDYSDGLYDKGNNFKLYQYVVPAGAMNLGMQWVIENLVVENTSGQTITDLSVQILIDNGVNGTDIVFEKKEAVTDGGLLKVLYAETGYYKNNTPANQIYEGSLVFCRIITATATLPDVQVKAGCRFFNEFE
jgi:hypothetical protein